MYVEKISKREKKDVGEGKEMRVVVMMIVDGVISCAKEVMS